MLPINKQTQDINIYFLYTLENLSNILNQFLEILVVYNIRLSNLLNIHEYKSIYYKFFFEVS